MNRLSREDRCGLVAIGEPTQIYEAPSRASVSQSTIAQGSTCLVVEVEIQKNDLWMRITCKDKGSGWVQYGLATKTFFGDRKSGEPEAN